jgi:endonuclease/exonuclease/phosphatase family metal-dependent hydrolase
MAVLCLSLLAGCASQDVTVRRELVVLVYNIHAGKDAAGVDNLERVAAVIESSNADLVLLQEVDRRTTRSGNVDQLATLMRLTGLHGAFGKSLDYQGGEYGIATLSRWPITSQHVVQLPVVPEQTRAGGSIEPRIALFVTTAAPAAALDVVNTHLDASREDDYRRQEVVHLLDALAAHTAPSLLLGGDFNSTPDNVFVAGALRNAGFRDAWVTCGRGNGLTYPAAVPVKRIDYLYLRGDRRCSSASVLESQASDHRAVLFHVER